MKVYQLDALTSTTVVEMSVREVRTLLSAIGSLPSQDIELKNISHELAIVSDMFAQLEDLV